MKLKQLTSIFTVILFSAFMAGCGGGSSSEEPSTTSSITPTFAMFDQIKLGMSKAQVETIAGGIAKPSYGFGTESYSWAGSNNKMNVCLKSNSVIYSAFFGPGADGVVTVFNRGNADGC